MEAPERDQEGVKDEGLEADGENEEWGEDEQGPPRGPQKRPLPATQSSATLGSIPSGQKTRGLPSLCDCHGCGRRFPDKGGGERLRLLDSQWRIVLLCKGCLWDVRSGQVCSYCFLGFVVREGGAVSCRECSYRVHVGCLPEERGYLVPSDLDPDLFTCVDCCAFPLSRFMNLSRFRDSLSSSSSSSSSSVSGVSDLCPGSAVNNVKAADVRNVVAAASVGAKSAADLAKAALDLVSAEKLSAKCVAVPDEELALQLHRAMNGSPRISRNLGAVHSGRLLNNRRGLSNVNLFDKEPKSGNFSVCGEVEPCTEDALFETMEIVDAEPLNVIGASEGNFIVNLDMGRAKHQSKEVILHREGDAKEMPGSEEQATCSDKFVNSSVEKSSVDGVSGSCRGPGGPNISPSQQDEKHSMPDRYMKKYYKRGPRTKDR